jgi:hypothetical protein
MFNVYKNQPSRQTGSRNLTGPKTLPTIWHTYMKLVTKYQIPVINSCLEKWSYMFNVYKKQLSRQTGSRNLTGPKTLPTIWYTYMTLVTKYQISAINSYWEKCNEKYLGRTEGQTEVRPRPPAKMSTITKNRKFGKKSLENDLWNCRVKWSQTMVKWSLDGPLSELYPTTLAAREDGGHC